MAPAPPTFPIANDFRTLNAMRLLMLGTGPFAVPMFRAFYDTRHRVVALVTAPLRSHRGQPIQPISSIRDIARAHGTEIVDPEDVNSQDAQARLAGFGPTCW